MVNMIESLMKDKKSESMKTFMSGKRTRKLGKRSNIMQKQ